MSYAIDHLPGVKNGKRFGMTLITVVSVVDAHPKKIKMENSMQAKTMRLILGDQLNLQHSWYKNIDKNIVYVMFEMRQETDYVTHHVQKIIAFFSAMRAFAQELEDMGHRVIYLKLDDENNTQSLTENLDLLTKKHSIQAFEYLHPDEYRLKQQLDGYCQDLNIDSKAFDSEHFLIAFSDIAKYFKKNTSMVMESFYRKVRKQFKVLMDKDEPIGGQWNYDKENRKKLPKGHVPVSPKIFKKDVTGFKKLLEKHKVKTFGEVDPDNFIWPTTRAESLEIFQYFLEECLENFGTYQDALTQEYWSVYHSRISFSLNTKMLSPLEVIKQAQAYWEKNQDKISLAQIEGFIRQVLGWREFMRGLYWINMPKYAEMNHFNHQRDLPKYFWTAETKMNCIKQSVSQSLEYAYAHHIQRLMVTGNFMLLAGIHPDAADAWYLGIYIDALEWVEMPNTRGMSQYADGGLVASKPYISSANYINKMGDYCSNCSYDPKKRTGDKACPFNSLYWNFLEKKSELRKNMRIRYSYSTWDRYTDEQKQAIIQQAESYLDNIEQL